MEICKCWQLVNENKQICNGTKEREECFCDGNENNCTCYPEKRNKIKILRTPEMWIQAQENDYCYETTYKEEDYITLYYQKDKGLFDDNQYLCKPDMWENFDELMNEQWQLRTMTKSEAEAKFNIKIVGD